MDKRRPLQMQAWTPHRWKKKRKRPYKWPHKYNLDSTGFQAPKAINQGAQLSRTGFRKFEMHLLHYKPFLLWRGDCHITIHICPAARALPCLGRALHIIQMPVVLYISIGHIYTLIGRVDQFSLHPSTTHPTALGWFEPHRAPGAALVQENMNRPLKWLEFFVLRWFKLSWWNSSYDYSEFILAFQK